MRDNWPMWVIGAVIVGVIGAIVAFAVLDARPVVGTVVERQFYPAHYENRTRMQCFPQSGGKSFCYPVPYTVWEPDAWWLMACAHAEENLPKFRRCRWRQVRQELYERVQIGEWYDEREQGR